MLSYLNYFHCVLVGSPKRSTRITLTRVHTSMRYISSTNHAFAQPTVGIFAGLKVHLRNFNFHQDFWSPDFFSQTSPTCNSDGILLGIFIRIGRSKTDWLDRRWKLYSLTKLNQGNIIKDTVIKVVNYDATNFSMLFSVFFPGHIMVA